MSAAASVAASVVGGAYVALTTLSDEARAVGLAEAIEALEPTGVGCFEIEDGSGRWEVGAYFDAAPDETRLMLLAAAFEAAPFAVSIIPPTDWVAHVQRELTPVRAGRVVLHGRHDRARIPPNAAALEIEAAMAFGTGHHGTTEGCLLALDWLRKRGLVARRVADVGCGTGVLAMAATKLWPAWAVATDIDATAAAATAANARVNGLGPRVVAGRAPGLRHPRMRAGAPYDLVLANILAGPLRNLTPEIVRRTAPGGIVVFSGLLIRQAPSVLSRAKAWGLREIARIDLRGWRTLILRRPPGRAADRRNRIARPPRRKA